MKVFLTGGTGNIGSHVALELLNRGHEVTILARNPGRIPLFQEDERIRIVRGELQDTETIRHAMQGQDACIHVALNYHDERKSQTILDDTVPTVMLANAAADAGVRHFIYTSSTSVHDTLYSLENRDPDETLVIDPGHAHSVASFYGASKVACEAYLMAFSYQTQMRVNVIRPGYTFGNPIIQGGPIQSDTRFMDLVQAAKKGKPIELDRKDGTQFISSRDIAKLYADLLESSHNRKVYYALSNVFVTWASIALEVIEKTQSRSKLILTDSGHKGGLTWDVSLMKTDFGLEFDPWPDLVTHIEQTIQRSELS